MTRIKIHISNVKLPFYPPCEVKCGLQNRVSTWWSRGCGGGWLSFGSAMFVAVVGGSVLVVVGFDVWVLGH